jgi:hypothetical protein
VGIEINETGVHIQGQATIVNERAAALKDPSVLGPNADTGATAALGRMINIDADREAAVQDALLQLTLNLDPATAVGYHLDVLCRLVGVEREPATFALSESGEVTTTGATTIPTGSIVRNLRTQADWVVAEDVVAVGAGTYAATIRSRVAGVHDFLGSDTWSIVTGVSNWSAFEASADLDPEDAGSERETDELLRARRTASLFDDGNDFDAIIAGVEQVTGVSYVGGLNNRTTGVVDGVPAGAIEIVVEGGDPTAIAQAIYDRLPPGTEAFGENYVAITTRLGTTIDVGYTRPEDTDVWLRATVSASGAEYAANPEIADLIADTMLTEANATMSSPGVDVIPQSLQGGLWIATRDARTGRPTLSAITIERSTNGSTWSTSPLAIDHKHRADFDSARIVVVGP